MQVQNKLKASYNLSNDIQGELKANQSR